MVNIFQHTQYCEGRGYVNKRSLSDAMAQEKATTRIQRDGQELFQNRLLQQALITRQPITPFVTLTAPSAAMLAPFASGIVSGRSRFP
ncbi:MAG: hypothetical protein U0003_01095 [Vampirovibrionales bacterium]